VAATTLLALAASMRVAAAQEVRGSIVDAATDLPIPGALVELRDEADARVTAAVSDSLGRFVLVPPAPGRYRIDTEHLAYESLRSDPLDLVAGERRVVTLVVAPDALALQGFEITADRFASIDRQLRLVLGAAPASLRYRPILRPEIYDHVRLGHQLPDLVRREGGASIRMVWTRDGPCFRWRQRHCLPVVLNGMRINGPLSADVPLEPIEVIQFLGPGESLAYGSGAVLLFTKNWLR
jgi:hypothetical protein